MQSLFSYYTQILFIVLIVINHLFEVYLSRRELETLQRERNSVPQEFKDIISMSDHQSAINYAKDRLSFGQVRLVLSALLLFYWFPMRGAENLYLSLPLQGMNRDVLFLVSFFLIQGLISLPFSLYSTFVIEKRHGFNRQSPKLFFIDRLKGLLLGALIGIPLLYGILFLYKKTGHLWWLWSFLVLTLFQFFILWIYPKFIAPLFNKFSPLENPELKDGIEGLVSSAGFNAKEVFVMDASKRSSHGNAYFTGFGKNKRVVFFDTLLKDLANKEILAILAHELGHMKLKHIPKSMVMSLILSFIGFYLMGILAKEPWFYTGHFIKVVTPGVLLLLFIEAVPVYTFWFGPISSWISRKREFEADAYAAKETNADDLVTGLLKLYQQNKSPVVTDKIYSGFYHSHPPALQRIRRLRLLK